MSHKAWIIAYPFAENKKEKNGRQYEKESWRLELKPKTRRVRENQTFSKYNAMVWKFRGYI